MPSPIPWKMLYSSSGQPGEQQIPAFLQVCRTHYIPCSPHQSPHSPFPAHTLGSTGSRHSTTSPARAASEIGVFIFICGLRKTSPVAEV